MNVVLMKIKQINDRIGGSTDNLLQQKINLPKLHTVRESPKNKQTQHEISIKLPVCNLNQELNSKIKIKSNNSHRQIKINM